MKPCLPHIDTVAAATSLDPAVVRSVYDLIEAHNDEGAMETFLTKAEDGDYLAVDRFVSAYTEDLIRNLSLLLKLAQARGAVGLMRFAEQFEAEKV